MAEQERLTKKERRERAREERKRKEAEQAAKAKRQRLTSILVTVLVIAVVAAVVWTAVGGGTEAASDITLTRAEAEEARLAAGCDIVDTTALTSSEHLEPATAPPAQVLYTGVTPTHSGPHFVQTSPTVPFTDRQLDERATTHNLEHGAVIVWYDPEQVDGATLEQMEAWSNQLNDAGFRSNGGGAIMVSAYTEPGIASGKAVALRAWSVAVDCDAWDETAANSFVLENYGTNGVAPERNISRFPEGILGYTDGEEPAGDEPTDGETTGDDATEPTGDDATDEPTDGDTEDGEG